MTNATDMTDMIFPLLDIAKIVLINHLVALPIAASGFM